MSHLDHIKPGKTKSNPLDPHSYPGYEEARKAGAKRWEKMKDDIGVGKTFENVGEKRDYIRKIQSNPSNVLGIPPTFPPINKLVGWTQWKYRGQVEYFCVGCDAPIENQYAKCEQCGYQTERCQTCLQTLYVRQNVKGEDVCMKCQSPILSMVTKEVV